MSSHGLRTIVDDPDAEACWETVPFEECLCGESLGQAGCAGYSPAGPRDGPCYSIGQRRVRGASRIPRDEPVEDVSNRPDGQGPESKPDR